MRRKFEGGICIEAPPSHMDGTWDTKKVASLQRFNDCITSGILSTHEVLHLSCIKQGSNSNKQGRLMSPLLLNLYMSNCLQELKNVGLGVKMHTLKVYCQL